MKQRSFNIATVNTTFTVNLDAKEDTWKLSLKDHKHKPIKYNIKVSKHNILNQKQNQKFIGVKRLEKEMVTG